MPGIGFIDWSWRAWIRYDAGAGSPFMTAGANMKTFQQRLKIESEDWVHEGLISSEQRAQVLARYPASQEGSRSLAILAMVGGTLFVVGVSLVIKANWKEIGDWVKIGGLVALLVASYAAGWRLKIRPGNYPKSGDACFMMGAAAFFLGIVLVSQIFHLNSRPPNGVLAWWIGIVLLPWLVRARGMQCVSLIAGLTWLFLELSAEDSWLRLFAAEGSRGDELTTFAAATFLIGFAVYGFGAGLRGTRHADFAGLHERFGLILASAGLYGVSLSWSTYRWMPHASEPARGSTTALLLALAGVALAWAWRRNRQDVATVGWTFAVGLCPALGILLGFNLSDGNWLFGGAASIALFVLNLGMIRGGVAAGRESWINLGIVGIALNILTRYFLLFGTMLEGGLFFIVTGLMVLGLGFYLERQRRKYVRAAREEVAP